MIVTYLRVIGRLSIGWEVIATTAQDTDVNIVLSNAW